MKKLKPTKTNPSFELFQMKLEKEAPILSQLYTRSIQNQSKLHLQPSKSNEKIQQKGVAYNTLEQIDEVDTQRSQSATSQLQQQQQHDTSAENENFFDSRERLDVNESGLKKPVFNPSILRKVDRSEMSMSEARDYFNRSESNDYRQIREMVKPVDIVLEQPRTITLKMDHDVEMEKVF